MSETGAGNGPLTADVARLQVTLRAAAVIRVEDAGRTTGVRAVDKHGAPAVSVIAGEGKWR